MVGLEHTAGGRSRGCCSVWRGCLRTLSTCCYLGAKASTRGLDPCLCPCATSRAVCAVLLPSTHSGYFQIEKRDTNTSVPKFLNRLLGLPLRDQDMLFTYFFSVMDSLIKQVCAQHAFRRPRHIAHINTTLLHGLPHQAGAHTQSHHASRYEP